MTQLEKEEFEEVSTLRNNLATVVTDAGQVGLQIRLLESDLEELNSRMKEYTAKFKVLIEQEQVLIKRLSEKYGAGTLNFETGEFTPER